MLRIRIIHFICLYIIRFIFIVFHYLFHSKGHSWEFELLFLSSIQKKGRGNNSFQLNIYLDKLYILPSYHIFQRFELKYEIILLLNWIRYILNSSRYFRFYITYLMRTRYGLNELSLMWRKIISAKSDNPLMTVWVSNCK